MDEATKFVIPPSVAEIITKIIKRGNCAEIKKENNQLVIVEIQRKVQTRTSITG